MGRTTALRRELKQAFVPFVGARGFVMDQRYAPQFLEFRRVVGDELHVFDIQWEKYGRPRFVVNFGLCPATGVEFGGQLISRDGVSAAHCATHGRLQPGKGSGLRHWFRQDKPWFVRLFSGQPLYPPNRVVELLVAMFAELEAFWERNEVGPHLRLSPSLRVRQQESNSAVQPTRPCGPRG